MKTEYPVLSVRGGINSKTLQTTNRLLGSNTSDVLYMVIDSTGGDPSIAYRMMTGLHAQYKRIVVIVPNMAYSAATLMALGADEIFMHDSACLGPLDIQIEHPSDGSMVSSLEIREILNTLAGSLKTYAEDFSDNLKTIHTLGKKTAAELAMKTATDLVKPVVEKIDPVYLQQGIRTSKLGQQYAETLLLKRMMKGSNELARLVSTYLANQYNYHGYAITPVEAVDLLALNVHKLETIEHWDKIKPITERDDRGVTLRMFEVTTPSPEELVKVSETDTANAKIKTEGAKK